jgi:hypothetical protein
MTSSSSSSSRSRRRRCCRSRQRGIQCQRPARSTPRHALLTQPLLAPPLCERSQGLAKKVERSRKQLKERKNRTKKIRGIKKNKSA